MKPTCLLILALSILPMVLRAQPYTIDWFTIDGGGGTSTGGTYSVSGTIGQPDAGRMSGANYTLEGGFWGVIAAIQTPGSPLLRVVFTTSNTVVVAWPNPSIGFALQENAVITTTNWVSVTNSPAVVGSEKQVIVSPPTGNRYYRLVSP